jgi:hypothetical protein
MTKLKHSKEINDIIKAIDKYINKHKGNVMIHGTLIAFKDKMEKNEIVDTEIVDDLVFAYGTKECIQIDLKHMMKHIKEEKDDFINW